MSLWKTARPNIPGVSRIMTEKNIKLSTSLAFQWNPVTTPLVVPRDSKQHQCMTRSGAGTKTCKTLQFTTPAWLGHHLLSSSLFSLLYILTAGFPPCLFFYPRPFCSSHPHFSSLTKKSLILINLPTLNTSLLVACCLRGSICTVPGGILCQRLTGDAAAAAGSYYAHEKEGNAEVGLLENHTALSSCWEDKSTDFFFVAACQHGAVNYCLCFDTRAAAWPPPPGPSLPPPLRRAASLG